MANNKLIDNGANPDFTISTDEVAGVDIQHVKLMGGTEDSTEKIEGTAAFGLEVDVTRLPVLGTGSKVQLTDGTSDATVRNLAANDALNVAIVDGAGNQITSIGGTGGTSATDDADFTAGSTTGTPMMGSYQSAVTAVTDTDLGIIGIDSSRRVKVTVDESTLDVAHDIADAGNPVKTGARAITALPTAVANNDRANNVSDVFGRQLVSHIDPGMFISKQVEATTAQTGSIVWDPAAGKKIAVTGYEIGTGGTTAALVTLWYGDTADTSFTQGTDQVLFRGSLTPSATATPGVISNFFTPVFCNTADRELHLTTSAGITIYVTVFGYEF